MAVQNNDDKMTGKDTDILDSDDLIDLDMALDDLTSSLDSSEQTITNGILDESLSDALEDLPLSYPVSENTSSIDDAVISEQIVAEHVVVEQAQLAAEQAAQASTEAVALAESEAQAAADAMAAAKQAMAAAEAAKKTAAGAKAAAQAKAEAETKALEEAKLAIAAEAKAKEEAEQKAREEAEAKAKAEAEQKAREEAEAKAKAEAEQKAREEAETEAKEEAEKKAREEAEAKAKKEPKLEDSFASLDADDFFSSSNIDEDEQITMDDNLVSLSSSDSLSSLEEEIGELTDWVEPENTTPITSNETTHLQSPSETPTITTSESPASRNDIAEEKPMTKTKKSGFNVANSIMMSIGLIAVLIAALALWMSLDASQKTTSLAAAPAKLQQKIDKLEQHQEKQTLLLQQQIKNLQDQLKILTNVISNKKTQQWQENIEQPETTNNAPQITQTSKPKPIVMAITSTSPKEILPNPEKMEVAIKKVTVKKQSAPALSTNKASSKVADQAMLTSPLSTSPESVQGWVVYLFSSKSQKSAERETRQFRKKGLDAKYIRSISKGVPWYHVLVSGFETERKAAAYKKFVKEYHGADAWYNKSANKITTLKINKKTSIKKPAFKSTPKTVSKKITTKTPTATHSFRFSAVQSDVWLQVSAPNAAATGKGKLLKEVLLKPGHHITIKASAESLWITTGNAPALSISVDSKVFVKHGSLGKGKKVLRNYRFNIK